MTIYIKNMVCTRCKIFVESELAQLGLRFTSVELGQANIIGNISSEQYDQIRSDLLKAGLELIDDIKTILIERIKNIVTELVQYTEEPPPMNLSMYLTQELHHNYTYMANTFSANEGQSIEKFYIKYKIERVKELLNYNEFNLTQIAFKMHYSSVAHLSSQFKKVTGDTPTSYKHLKEKKRALTEAK